MQLDRYSSEVEQKPSSLFKTFWLYYLFIIAEFIMVMLYGLFVEFVKLTGPKHHLTHNTHSKEEIIEKYPFFQDVNVMIFIGFGFLMTFLKKYFWSAVAKNFVLAACAIQLGILSLGFWKAVLSGKWEEKIDLSVEKFIYADFCAGSILIAFGAVIGKLHFTQYIVMATIQTIIYGLSMNLGFNTFRPMISEGP